MEQQSDEVLKPNLEYDKMFRQQEKQVTSDLKTTYSYIILSSWWATLAESWFMTLVFIPFKCLNSYVSSLSNDLKCLTNDHPYDVKLTKNAWQF